MQSALSPISASCATGNADVTRMHRVYKRTYMAKECGFCTNENSMKARDRNTCANAYAEREGFVRVASQQFHVTYKRRVRVDRHAKLRGTVKHCGTAVVLDVCGKHTRHTNCGEISIYNTPRKSICLAKRCQHSNQI